MAHRPIGDYGLIGNKLTAALVSTVGSIDWWCLPAFDSPSVFAAILDEKKGGSFQIRPRGRFRRSQAYLPNTNLLTTTFETQDGRAVLTDFMPCYRDARGRLVHPNRIYRTIECTHGRMEIQTLFVPRPDYARAAVKLSQRKHGVVVDTHQGPLGLSSSVRFKVKRDKAVATFSLDQGDGAAFILHPGEPLAPGRYRTRDRLRRTRSYWEKEAKGGVFYGIWQEPILRSYLAMHLLISEPAGAIIAAPTTSLPEEIGGERNWDYRYAWLRDASAALSAFSLMGHKDEAAGFMDWLSRVCSVHGPDGQVLYSIDSSSLPDEQTLEHLSGYRGSRPVRIGNNAYRQRQLDVFGEVLEAAYNYLNIRGYISKSVWRLLEDYVDAACRYWQEPDNSIWEVRSPPLHFVHSRLMCWVALDRGIKIGRAMGYRRKLAHWQRTADEIRNDIISRGWKPGRGAFTQHYETDALDATALLIPIYRFLPISDERVMSTIKLVREELTSNGFLLRYRLDQTSDGLPGQEGAFLACSCWLVRNLIRLNRLDEAVALFRKILDCRNHLGLYSEMVDPKTGEALGNFPLVLTHLNVIIAGMELNQATLWGW